MTKFLEKIIFAIDDDKNLHNVAKFLRHVDTQRAMGNIKPVVQCIGSWRNYLEKSYMMDLVDYNEYVKPWGWAVQQECVLIVPGDTRQPCTLQFASGQTRSVGPMVQTDVPTGNWTYVIETDKYFYCADA